MFINKIINFLLLFWLFSLTRKEREKSGRGRHSQNHRIEIEKKYEEDSFCVFLLVCLYFHLNNYFIVYFLCLLSESNL